MSSRGVSPADGTGSFQFPRGLTQSEADYTLVALWVIFQFPRGLTLSETVQLGTGGGHLSIP